MKKTHKTDKDSNLIDFKYSKSVKEAKKDNKPIRFSDMSE